MADPGGRSACAEIVRVKGHYGNVVNRKYDSGN